MTTTTKTYIKYQEPCRYCGGNCSDDEDHACDSYIGDIDNLYYTHYNAHLSGVEP